MALLCALLGAAAFSTTFAAPTVLSGLSLDPDTNSSSRFTFFDLQTPLAGPCDLNTGPNGEIYASTFFADKLVYIDRTSEHPTLQEITIPYTDDQLPTTGLPQRLQGAGSCVVQPGGDGNVYLATGIRNQLAQYNPRNGQFKFFEATGGPLGNLQPFNDAWPGQGGMWFTQTTANQLTFFDYETENMTSYEVPTPLAVPVGVIVVPNGDVWICEFAGQKVAKFDIQTKTFIEYPVPPTLLGPAVVRAFTDNQYIWFTAIVANAIGRVDIFTGEITAYPNTANLGLPIEDTNDGNGNIWFSTALSNTLNYLTPSTGEFTTIPQPDGGITTGPVSVPPLVDIAMHWVCQDNSMWFTELAGNRVGRYQLTGNEGESDNDSDEWAQRARNYCNIPGSGNSQPAGTYNQTSYPPAGASNQTSDWS